MDKDTIKLLDELKDYECFNEQEEKDKENIIKYINDFDNIFERTNTYGHITTSAWAVNKNRDKVLMVYHKIYDSWSWTGGHADGEKDLLNVAKRELMEETGIVNPVAVSDKIFGIEIAGVDGHIKRGEYVSSHEHVNFTYLFEVSEEEELKIKEDENTDVKWIAVDKVKDEVSEVWMYNRIYKKYLDKVEKLKESN